MKSVRILEPNPNCAIHGARLSTTSSNDMPVESPDTQSNISPEVFIDSSSIMEDFIIGDRVIIGKKLGIIAFIGDVKFAAGEWAGIILDEPAGKNDGIVQGTRYFQCDAKRGVFSRLAKLQRAPNTTPRPPSSLSESRNPGCRRQSQTQSPYHNRSQLIVNNNNNTRKESIGSRSSGTRTPNRERKDSGSSLSNASTNNGSSYNTQDSSNLRVGQRVLVNNNKTGILRYLGSTDFAQGEWAGVELDQPLGKNEGSVNGKRYFECKQSHGLFAPVHKVTVISTGSPSLRRRGTPNGHTSPHPGTPRRASQESLTSTGSSASIKNNSTNGLDKRRKSQTFTTVPSLQKALREKEQHIEQLLKEREMERSVFTANSADKSMAGIQSEYSQLVTLTEGKIKQFTSQIERLEQENKSLTTELHDSKQQIEDLQFQIEEDTILNEEKTGATDSSLVTKDLEAERKLRTQAENLLKTAQTELDRLKVEYDKSEETQLEYLDQIDELSHTITVTERQISSQGTNRNDALSAQIEESETLRAENRKLKSEIAQLEKRLQGQTHLSDKNHELLQEQLSTAHNKISNLQTQADNSAKIQSDREELNTRLTNTELQLTESSEQLKTTETELDNTTNHNKKLTEQLAELEQRLAQLTNQTPPPEQSTLQSQLDSTLS